MHHMVAALFCASNRQGLTSVANLSRPDTSEAVPGAFVIILAQEPESPWTFSLRQVPLWLARVVQVVGSSYKLHYFARCRCTLGDSSSALHVSSRAGHAALNRIALISLPLPPPSPHAGFCFPQPPMPLHNIPQFPNFSRAVSVARHCFPA